MRYDAIVIGGGAAGLFCAANAARRGRRVLVLEHNSQCGRKILISGGGRCNFTNLDVGPENYLSQNPHFCKSALARYTPTDLLELVRRHRITYYEKTLGQLFCRDSAHSIVEMLLAECESAKALVRTGISVSSVEKDEDFRVNTTVGEFRCESLVIASGGLSFPKVGATDLGYRIARQFGLKQTELRPSLVALAAKRDLQIPAGISLPAVVATGKAAFRENILFTHRGLSGPAILQISNYWRKDVPVSIDLLPDIDDPFAGSENSGKTTANYLAELLPKRFVDAFLPAETFGRRAVGKLSPKERLRLTEMIKDHKVYFTETEGYGRAEVTLGGIATDELSSTSMAAKKVPGLFFIGEVVDVTGWLGGYNFQWAWSSAYAAAEHI